MTVGSTTADIAMINLVVVAADGSGGLWQDPVQTIPHGMNGDPVAFIAKLQAGLPLVNNLRVFLNEYSFNPDGSLHPQMESFLSAAAAAFSSSAAVTAAVRRSARRRRAAPSARTAVRPPMAAARR